MTQSRFPATRRGGTTTPSIWWDWSDWMNRFTTPFFGERYLATGSIAPVDVCERDNFFVVRMACADCRPEDIEVTVENDTVRIRGKFIDHDMMSQEGMTGGQQMGGQQGGQREVCLIRELPTGRFERDITLPTAVNAKQTHASFEFGMLTLTLPKTEAAMGHRINIGQATGAGTR
jgi:HSP20 family protein